jgi:hypothetical protein
MKAFCWRTGKIEFGDRTPRGALTLLDGPEVDVRSSVIASARHAYDGHTLLVPGVPEAEDEVEAVDAVARFCSWLRKQVVSA